MRTRWSAYAGASTALAGGVVIKALAQRPNFYSAAVYLSQSSANLMIMTNFIFVASCTILLGLQKLLYGPLRPIEIEQLYEKAWFAVTETCLAMTIFRGEIGAWFLVMFFALLAGKVWAWIGDGRVEILEQQPPRNPRLFHTRLALSLGLSVCFNLTMLEYVVQQVRQMPRPDMMVMFGFEFAVLSIVSLSTASRYAINLAEIAIVRQQKARRIEEIRKERAQAAMRVIEEAAQQSTGSENATSTTDSTSNATALSVQAAEAARRASEQPVDEQELEVEGWEGKGRWIFYLDLATDFFKLVVYLSFFFILLIFYGLPIHILRDVFMTFRSFFKRIGDFMRYRTATRDMNARYPDATEQDIGREDVCIICREEMRPYQPPANGERANPVAERMRPKKLPCGHVLHFSCLRSWLERQQICPTCRTNVVTRNTTRGRSNNAAAGAAGGQAGQHGNAAPGERPAARIYQLGPLRIGLGAGRGNNMLEDLQQQLVDGQARQPQQVNGDGPQQYGFGIRWDGLRRRDRTDRGPRNIQRQLDDVQRQINQEYRALGQMTQELRLLRNMEAELTRIRAQRQGNSGSALPTTSHASGNMPTITALAGDTSRILPAGSDRLPAGLTLPEGWSLMPLHPAQGALPQLGAQPMPNSFQAHMPGIPANGIPGGLSPPNTNDMTNHAQQNPASGSIPNQNDQAQQIGTAASGEAAQTTQGISSRPGPPTAERLRGPFHEQVERIIADARAGSSHVQSGNQTGDASSIDASSQDGVAPVGDGLTSSGPGRVSAATDGSAAGDVRANQSAVIGQSTATVPEEIPVSSMFTLPPWGSASADVAATAGAEHSHAETEGEETNGISTPGSDSESEPEIDGSSEPANVSKNPTVEDLVDEPD